MCALVKQEDHIHYLHACKQPLSNSSVKIVTMYLVVNCILSKPGMVGVVQNVNDGTKHVQHNVSTLRSSSDECVRVACMQAIYTD